MNFDVVCWLALSQGMPRTTHAQLTVIYTLRDSTCSKCWLDVRNIGGHSAKHAKLVDDPLVLRSDGGGLQQDSGLFLLAGPRPGLSVPPTLVGFQSEALGVWMTDMNQAHIPTAPEG